MNRSFASELCEALARDHYTPAAWTRFWARAWRHSRRQMAASQRRRHSTLGWLAAVTGCGLGVLWASGDLLAVPTAAAWRWTLWMAVMAAWLFLHQGLVDEEAGHSAHPLGLPNGLSFSRLALAPLVAAPGLLAPGGRHLALRIALVACVAVTDLADGQLARRLKQTTRLGRTLDPLADLALLSWLAWGLQQSGAIDGLLLGLVLLRWPGALLLALALFFAKARRPPPSSALGKATTAATLVVLGVLSLQVIAHPAWLPDQGLAVATGALEVLLGASIVWQGWRVLTAADWDAPSDST